MEHLNEVRTHIYGINPIKRVLTISDDMSEHEDIESVIATTLIAFYCQLGVLVNKALTIGPSPIPYLLDYPLEDFDYVIDINLVGPFLIIKKALPAMIEHNR
jgi:NAD(P)-dependent dehydrogenase (short-subunit alcohol dehydrogenase family)